MRDNVIDARSRFTRAPQKPETNWRPMTKEHHGAVAKQRRSQASRLQIREWRQQRGFSMDELAMRLCKSKGWVSRVESGMCTPNIVDLEAVASVLNVEIGQLFKPHPGAGAA